MKTNLILDKIFKESKGLVEFTFNIYRKIYSLKTIKFEGFVSGELFQYAKKRKNFVLLVIYDEQGKVYLSRNMQEDLYWALPGGSIYNNESLHSAVKRIAAKINSQVVVGEIEPVSFVKNIFKYKDKIHEHTGIGVIARMRNKDDFNFSKFEGKFVEVNSRELARINRFANRELVSLCRQRFNDFHTGFPELEVKTNEQYRWRYFIHNKIMKRFFLTPTIKKKKEFLSIILGKIGKSKSFIDVSSGDSDLIHKIKDDAPFLEYLVANDVSWSQMDIIDKFNKNIIFTNHNAIHSPFKENSFDVSFCANTLHHMQNRDDLLNLLERTFKIANKTIIVEVENPKITGLIPKLLNKFWYIKFLKDVGGAYLSEDEFRTLVKEKFEGRGKIEFTIFKNIQGKYMIAEITKNNNQNKADVNLLSNSVLEVEDKYFLNSKEEKDKIKEILKEKGFTEKFDGVETDSYYTDIDGDYIRNRTCLRVRSSENDKMELTYKGKTSNFSSLFGKKEINLKLEKDSMGITNELLESLNYYKYVDVVKRRNTFSKISGDLTYSVVVDQLNDVGNFVEFEITTHKTDKYTFSEIKKKLQEFLTDFSSIKLLEASIPYRDFVANHLAKNVLKKKKITTILLDLDGTLLPTEFLFFECWKKVCLDDYRISINKDDYLKFELSDDSKYFEELKKKGMLNREVTSKDFMQKVYKEYDVKLKNFLKQKSSISPLVFLLKELKRKYKLGLVSTSKKKYIDMFFEHSSIKEVFDVVVSRDDVSKLKPNSEAYLLAMDKLSVVAQECLVVEDSVRGIMAAQNAGINTVAVTRETITPVESIKELGVGYFYSFLDIALILLYTREEI